MGQRWPQVFRAHEQVMCWTAVKGQILFSVESNNIMGAMTKTTRAVHLSLDSIALSLRATKAKGYFTILYLLRSRL